MSDQPEKPKGTLPKGYEPNAQGEPQDQDKKIWDKYYNGEIELPDVVKELKHIRSSEDTELETSDEVREDQQEKDTEGDEPNTQVEPQDQDKKIWDKYYNGEIELPNVVKELKHDGSNEDTKLETSDEDRDAVLKAWRRTQNIYGYSQQKAKSKQGMEKEREEYEKKYLARYKEPKVKSKKSTKLKSDIDLGKLNLRKHAVTKQKKYLAERKDYERKYLARYKQPKVKRSKKKK